MSSTTQDRIFGANSSLAIKAPVRLATSGNIVLSALQSIDGSMTVAEDRVLVKDQTDASENGIYIATTSDWERAPDFDGNRDIVKGTTVHVTDGGANADTWWEVTSANPIVVDTDDIDFALSLTASMSTLSFTQGGTGATARTAQNKMRDVISVIDFETVCDGATDDSAAIQLAEDYAETLVGATYGGVAVYFPGARAADASYLINTKLTVKDSSIRWYGDNAVGSQLQAGGNNVTVLEVANTVVATGIGHFEMEDIYVHGTGALSTVPGIIFNNVQRSQLTRVAVLGFDTAWQLKASAGNGSYTNTARDCRFDACNTVAVDIQAGSHVTTLDTCQIGGGPRGVKCVDSADLRVINCDIEDCTTYGISVDEVASVLAFNANPLILGNHFEGNVGRDILLGATNVVNSANVIGNTFGSTAATKPVDAVKAANLNVIGNLAYNWTALSLITLGTVTGYNEHGNIVNIAGAAAHAAGTLVTNTFSNLSLFPKQTAFLALPSAQAVDQTGDGTAYTVAFATEVVDQGSDFASPTFTARASALHRFQATVQMQGLLAGHTSGVLELIVAGTSARTYELDRSNIGAARDAIGAATMGGSTFANMTSGDTATIVLTVSGGTKVVDINTSSRFSGGLAT